MTFIFELLVTFFGEIIVEGIIFGFFKIIAKIFIFIWEDIILSIVHIFYKPTKKEKNKKSKKKKNQ